MCTENLTLTYKSFNGRPSDFLLLDTPNVNTKYGKRLFEYNGSRLWNALSFDVRNAENIEYFKKKLYRSLNVPPSRMDGEGGFNLGRSSEILRDELKFTKFVGRLRKRFAQMFNDMLKTQLILKNEISPCQLYYSRKVVKNSY